MTKKQLAAAHRRRLKSIRRALLEMSALWDGVDQFCMGSLEELADKAAQVAADLVEEEGPAS